MERPRLPCGSEGTLVHLPQRYKAPYIHTPNRMYKVISENRTKWSTKTRLTLGTNEPRQGPRPGPTLIGWGISCNLRRKGPSFRQAGLSGSTPDPTSRGQQAKEPMVGTGGRSQGGSSPFIAPAPSSVSVTTYKTMAEVSWSEVPGAVNYKITGFGTPNSLSKTSMEFSGLSCGTQYTFSVQAKVQGSDWGQSRSVSGTTKACDPVAPTNVGSRPILDDVQEFFWEGDSYYCYQMELRVGKRVLGLPVPGTEWKRLPFESHSIRIDGLTARVGGFQPNTYYLFRVRAVDGDHESAWVEVETTTPRPFIGHQADLTVQYEIGPISPSALRTLLAEAARQAKVQRRNLQQPAWKPAGLRPGLRPSPQ